MRDYYREIDKALEPYELGRYATHSISWITDRIAWCWKFKHITKEQMSKLADRVICVLTNSIK